MLVPELNIEFKALLHPQIKERHWSVKNWTLKDSNCNSLKYFKSNSPEYSRVSETVISYEMRPILMPGDIVMASQNKMPSLILPTALPCVASGVISQYALGDQL